MEKNQNESLVDEKSTSPDVPCMATVVRAAGDSPGYLFIRDEKEYAKISLGDIRYISGDAEYLSLYTCKRDKPYREKSSFALIRKLLTDSFIQIHRSSIINMKHVASVGRGYVLMDDGTKIRISEGRKDEFSQLVDSRTVGKNHL